MFERALSLSTPKLVRRHLDHAEAVGLFSRVAHNDFSLISVLKNPTSVYIRVTHARFALRCPFTRTAMLRTQEKLGQIKPKRCVGDEITTLGRFANAAPQAAMYVRDLISLFDPAVLTLIEAIPVTHGGFINVAVRPAAGI